MTLRGWGFTFDMATGTNRTWYVGEDGVRRYMDDTPVENLNELSGDSGQLGVGDG